MDARVARSAVGALAGGALVGALFAGLRAWGRRARRVDLGAVTFDFAALPAPELVGLLVAAAAFLALLTWPRPRAGPWWAWGAARGAAGALALAVPTGAVLGAAGVRGLWWTLVLLAPVFLALFGSVASPAHDDA